MEQNCNKMDHTVKLKMGIAVTMIMDQIVSKLQVICVAQMI
jgi:hypothetical protein